MARLLIAMLLLALAPPTSLRAEPPVNAALRYWPFWSLELTPERERLLASLAPTVAGDDWRAPADPSQLASDDELRELVATTNLPHCDFQLDRARGMGLLLPDVGKLHSSARLLAACARIRLDAADRDGAVELLTAGYRLAGHTAAQRTGVHSASALRMLRLIDSVAARADLQRPFSPTQRAALLDALAWVDDADPLLFRDAYLLEGASIASWIRAESEAPGGVDRLMTVFQSIRSMNDVAALPLARGPMLLAIQREGGFPAAADGIERFHRDARAAMEAGNPDLEVARAKDALRQGAYGSLARAIASEPFLKGSREAAEAVFEARARWQAAPADPPAVPNRP